jgi:predicted nucleic acid-binding protein
VLLLNLTGHKDPQGSPHT